jgi:hypothetical protein
MQFKFFLLYALQNIVRTIIEGPCLIVCDALYIGRNLSAFPSNLQPSLYAPANCSIRFLRKADNPPDHMTFHS